MKEVILVPRLNANDDVVVIVRWHARDGVQIETGAPLVDVETTKIVTTLHADRSGWVRHRCREQDEVPVGADLAWICSSEEELAAETAPPLAYGAFAPSTKEVRNSGKMSPTDESPAFAEFPVTTPTQTRFTAATEKLAADLGLDLDTLAAKNLGLVTSSILRSIVGQGHQSLDGQSKGDAATEGMRRERIPAAKRAEIEALRQGAGEHLTSSLSIQFDSIEIRAYAESAGHGLLPVLLAELAPLLLKHTKFTAFAEGETIVFQDAVNLGVAIDIGEGLRVVVIHDADELDAGAIAERLAQLTLDYMERKLEMGAVLGATFTVTDLSGLDIFHVAPLINGRQSAILGIGADSMQAGYPMTLTIAFDHRVLSGREVGEFLQALRSRIFARVALGATAPAFREKPNTACCDMCLTPLETYHEEFGQSAYAVMTLYMRRNGTTGLICHRCRKGWV